MSFHTITLNFILILSKTLNEFDTIMSMFCKYFKKNYYRFRKINMIDITMKKIFVKQIKYRRLKNIKNHNFRQKSKIFE